MRPTPAMPWRLSILPMTSMQLHRLMSITDEAILKLKEENYSQSVLLRKKFDRLQDELFGNPIK
jgi:hypothetical protein